MRIELTSKVDSCSARSIAGSRGLKPVVVEGPATTPSEMVLRVGCILLAGRLGGVLGADMAGCGEKGG